MIFNLQLKKLQINYRTSDKSHTISIEILSRNDSTLLYGVAHITFMNKKSSKCHCGYFNESKISIY